MPTQTPARARATAEALAALGDAAMKRSNDLMSGAHSAVDGEHEFAALARDAIDITNEDGPSKLGWNSHHWLAALRFLGADPDAPPTLARGEE